MRATSGQSHVMYLARFCIESKLAQELEYDDTIKTFLRRHEKVYEAIMAFAPISESVNCLQNYFRLNLAGFDLRILRIGMQLRMQETSDA